MLCAGTALNYKAICYSLKAKANMLRPIHIDTWIHSWVFVSQ